MTALPGDVGHRLVHEHLAVADLQVEAAVRVGADPCLELHRCPLSAKVGQRHEVAFAAPAAGGELGQLHRVGHARHLLTFTSASRQPPSPCPAAGSVLRLQDLYQKPVESCLWRTANTYSTTTITSTTDRRSCGSAS